MNRARDRLACCAAFAGALAMVATACAPAAPPTPTSEPRTEAPRPSATVAPTPMTRPAATPAGTPEKASLKLGLAAAAVGHLPFYLGSDRTYREEGLDVELVSFSGAAGVMQAVASDSVDIGAGAANSLVNMIAAGQPVKALYVGRYASDLEWFARPEIKDWAGLQGKSIAIPSLGSLPDFLTRYALRKHGLEPERDVQFVPVGLSANAIQALQTGKVDAAILLQPITWQAESEGFTRLGTQASEVAEQWPSNLFIVKESFLDQHPNTIRALLRAHVTAIRLAKADRELAVQAIITALKYERPQAERAYAETISGFEERGMLPAKAMPVFWEVATSVGDVSEPWPESRFFDRRFVDTFDAWAPR